MRMVIFLTLVLALPFSGHAAWYRADTDHFIVFGDVPKAKVEDMARELESLFGAMGRILAVEIDRPAPRVTVLLTENIGEMHRLFDLPDQAAAFYSSRPEGPFAVVPAFSSNNENLGANIDYLKHELGHHFQYQFYGRRFPVWFSEGFGEYAASIQVQDKKIAIGKTSQLTLSRFRRNLSKAKDILSVQNYDQADGENLYGTAYAMVHYFFSTAERQRGMQAYLQALQSGRLADEAVFQATTGLSYREFDRALRRHRKQFPFFEIAQTVDREEVDANVLDSALGALLRLELILDQSGQEDAATRGLTEVQSIMADDGASDFAHILLARHFLALGNPDEALEQLSLVQKPSAKSLYWQARTIEHKRRKLGLRGKAFFASLAESNALFSQAFQLDRTFAAALWRYGRTIRRDKDGIPGEAVTAIAAAYRLLPQATPIGLDLAGALLLAGQYEQAESLAAGYLAGHISSASRIRATALRYAAKARQLPADRRFLWNFPEPKSDAG